MRLIKKHQDGGFFVKTKTDGLYSPETQKSAVESSYNWVNDWKNHEYNISTDELLRRSRLVNNNITKIRNVEDLANKSKIKYNDDLIIHEGTPRISFLGNNGDLTGKSIYR